MLLFTTSWSGGVVTGCWLLAGLLLLYGVGRLVKAGVVVARQVVLVTRQGLQHLQNPQTQRTGLLQLVPAGIIASMLLTMLSMISQSMPGSQRAGLAPQKRVATMTGLLMKASPHRLAPQQRQLKLNVITHLSR